MPSPHDSLFNLTADGWNAIFAGVNAVVVVFGIAFAVRNLYIMTKQQYFAAFTRFMDDLNASAVNRYNLYHNFPIPDDYSKISREDAQVATEVINFLNRTATLVEEKMLPPKVVLSMMHTVIILCWFKLEGYVDYRERISGGRYARRVRKLAQCALKFHDCRRHQRVNPVVLFEIGGQKIEVYRTKQDKGFAGFVQFIFWEVRNWRARYGY